MAKKKQAKFVQPVNSMDMASAISDRVQIREITLVKSNSWRAEFLDPQADDFALDMNIKLAYLKQDQEKSLRVLLDFQLEGKVKDDQEATPLIRVGAVFVLEYSVDNFNGLTNENFEAFADLNGVFHGWPFWREFVLNTTARMGIPPITLPVHRVAPSERKGM